MYSRRNVEAYESTLQHSGHKGLLALHSGTAATFASSGQSLDHPEKLVIGLIMNIFVPYLIHMHIVRTSRGSDIITCL